MGRISISGGGGNTPYQAEEPHPPPPTVDHLTEKSRSFSTGRMNHMSSTHSSQDKPRVTFREDVMAGVMMAGALTQWNAASASGLFAYDGWSGAAGANTGTSHVTWDWGMGWGWAGWTPEGAMPTVSAPAFCGSCALEQHQAALAASSSNYPNMGSSGRHEFYFDDDHELGELGDTDVNCDFGGDFGGFWKKKKKMYFGQSLFFFGWPFRHAHYYESGLQTL